MTLIRFISSLLTLALLATAATGAALRVDAGTGQFVTICAGGQSVTVELDHTGAPIDPRPHCPDCVSVIAFLADPSTPSASEIETRLVSASLRLSQTRANVPTALARAPPASV